MSRKTTPLFSLATRAKLLCRELNSTFVPPEMGRDGFKLFVIGEAPGAEEEEQRAPFVGESGQLLRHALRDVFGDEFAPYITNVVPYRPSMRSAEGNRPPTTEECAPFYEVLMEQLRRVKPRVVMVLGNTAGRTLSGHEDFKITSYMGRDAHDAGRTCNMSFEREGERVNFRVVPCVHPSFVLRSGGVGTYEWARFVKRFRIAKEFVEANDRDELI